MATCSFCEIEGHTIRTCRYKEKLPFVHAIVGHSIACGLEKLPSPPEKILNMERDYCPTCMKVVEGMQRRK